jgi:hypothetical protein
MLYGLILGLLFLGLALHYILIADASFRSKAIIAGLAAAWLFGGRWMPSLLLLSIEFLVPAYILIVYRLEAPSSV